MSKSIIVAPYPSRPYPRLSPTVSYPSPIPCPESRIDFLRRDSDSSSMKLWLVQ